jgi:hypothetical protein
MASRSIVLLAMGMVVFFFASISSADVPDSIHYQGKLTTASGGCLNDTVQMTFTIYADAFGIVSEWSETQTQVEVKEGIFNVLLGRVNPLPASIFHGTAKYLGVQVESDPEMRPLKPMVTTAYAFGSHHAQEADTADYARAAPAVSDGDWQFSGNDIYRLGGKVGIGITPSQYKLEVVGDAVSGQPLVRIENTAGIASSARTLLVKGGEHASDIYTFGVADASNNVDFSVMGNGFVGIGTTSPNSRLEVAGTIHSTSGGYKFPDGSSQTTAAILPHGVIVMWSGTLATIPSGWALCDGTNGTPDLRDRFIYGCSTGQNPGPTGGVVSHSHTVDVPPCTTGVGSTKLTNVSTLGGAWVSHWDHTHIIDPRLTETSTVDNLPPYYKLAFIMKL